MSSYRTEALRCPKCDEPMRERRTAHAVVDVCGQCSGLWIEWFDGEMTQVAREAEAGDLPEAVPAAREYGSLTCPTCRVELELRRYPSHVDGAEVLRCGECAGAFVPRGSGEQLASSTPEEHTADDPGLLERLTSSLRRLFGWGAE
ncbi:MAG TPA: zf-TFIIB domain-containing protein [Polyangiaceae bacterium]|nr:zf-TFIIB domain-containing protein [Polyangiaceae bacterium]